MKGSLSCAIQRPILGSGPGTFSLAFQEVHSVDHQSTEYVNAAHNDPLQFLVETGFLGFLLWLCLNGSLLFFAWKSKRHSGAWLAGGVAGLFLLSLFNFVVPALTTSLWLFFLLGLTALNCPPKQKMALTPNWNLGISFLLILAGSWTFLTGVRNVVVTVHLENSQRAREAGDLTTSLAQLNQALRWAPKDPGLRMARAEVSQDLANTEPDMAEGTGLDLKVAAQVSPRNLEILGRCVLFFVKQDQLETALEFALQAHRFAPYHDKTRVRLAAVYSLRGELEPAARTLIPRAARNLSVLAKIVYQLERESPGKGLPLLSALDRETLRKLAEKIRSEALKARDKDVLSRLQDTLLPLEGQNSLKAELQRAKDLHSLGDKAEAEQILERTVHPANRGKEGYSEALAFWSQLAGTKSLPYLIEHLDLHPEDVDVRIGLSELLPASEATKLLTRGLELSPRNRRLNHQMGVIFEREGMPELAENYYRESKGRAP